MNLATLVTQIASGYDESWTTAHVRRLATAPAKRVGRPVATHSVVLERTLSNAYYGHLGSMVHVTKSFRGEDFRQSFFSSKMVPIFGCNVKNNGDQSRTIELFNDVLEFCEYMNPENDAEEDEPLPYNGNVPPYEENIMQMYLTDPNMYFSPILYVLDKITDARVPSCVSYRAIEELLKTTEDEIKSYMLSFPGEIHSLQIAFSRPGYYSPIERYFSTYRIMRVPRLFNDSYMKKAVSNVFQSSFIFIDRIDLDLFSVEGSSLKLMIDNIESKVCLFSHAGLPPSGYFALPESVEFTGRIKLLDFNVTYQDEGLVSRGLFSFVDWLCYQIADGIKHKLVSTESTVFFLKCPAIDLHMGMGLSNDSEILDMPDSEIKRLMSGVLKTMDLASSDTVRFDILSRVLRQGVTYVIQCMTKGSFFPGLDDHLISALVEDARHYNRNAINWYIVRCYSMCGMFNARKSQILSLSKGGVELKI